MSNKIKEFFNKFNQIFNKLTILQKSILVGILFAVIGFIVFSIDYSTNKEYVYLFKKPLSTKDYGLITAELQKNGELFETVDDKFILVQNEESGARIRMSLAQNDLLPNDIKGWELFDMESWTTTEFDRNIKLRRAIEGEMKRHIESLIWVETAEVTIAIPPQTLYTERSQDVSAAVTLRPAEGYYESLKSKKTIQGIQNIIARGIDGINPNNIVITDFNGNQINNFKDSDYENNIKQALEESYIQDREIRKIKNKIESALDGVLSSDRYRVAVDVEVNFNRKTIDQKKILPIVIKSRTPGLPYDDSIVVENIKVSEKQTSENFEGLGFIPEGPPGQEPNIPPGYKESLDGRNKYNKDEKINNYINGEQVIKQVDDAMEIEKKSVSITVDGTWSKIRDDEGNLIIENEMVKREYTPMSETDIKKIEELIKGSINYNSARGDKVVVENIAFDRNNQFISEDSDIIFNEKLQQYTFYGGISLLLLIFVIILFIKLNKLYVEYKEEKEKEMEKMRSIQREQILSDIESMETEIDYSDTKKSFKRIQEELMNMIKKDSKNAAQVVKLWLAKDNEA